MEAPSWHVSVIAVSGEEQIALGHKYSHSKERLLNFSSYCIGQSKSHASLTSKRDWEVKSHEILKKGKRRRNPGEPQ